MITSHDTKLLLVVGIAIVTYTVAVVGYSYWVHRYRGRHRLVRQMPPRDLEER